MVAPAAREGFPAIAKRVSAVVILQVCDSAGCQEGVVQAEGWVDSADAWSMAYHLPSDPLRGTTLSGETGGHALIDHLIAMVEVANGVKADEVRHAPQEQSHDAEGRR